ncbi:MAG: type I 3-dehydroquinate dehydratase [Haloarculaceae archaeon]
MDFGGFRLAASTADLADEPAAREHADIVEFRLDLAAEPMAQLRAYEGELPLLVTNRVAWEGGEAADTPRRLDRLATAVEHPRVEAVDLELAALTAAAEGGDGTADHSAVSVREAARKHGVSVLVSIHDFEGTPGRERLAELLARAAEHGDVAKLAVTAESPDDVLALLAVTRDMSREGRRVATMAMGEAGRHSRAVAPLYGSRVGYAPVDPAEATAPGQYALATLAGLVERLGLERAEDSTGGHYPPSSSGD